MRAAVLGSPVAHSLSPALHRAAYAALDLDWRYDAVETRSEQLPALLDSLDADWAGLSLTMPLKHAVLPLLTSRSDLVVATGAANTVVLRDGQRAGHNTDVAGVVAALGEAGVDACHDVVVLGAGATAASAVVALAMLGARRGTVLARRPQAAGAVVDRAAAAGLTLEVGLLEARPVAGDVVLSTLPAGAADGLARALAVTPPGGLPASVLLDVAYDPWPSRLASAYLAAGATVVPGALMLLHQAAAQVELMTGLPAPLEAMRTALPQHVRAALKP